jgi:acetyl esterase/lipase
MRFALALALALPALAQQTIPLRPGEKPDPKIPPEKIEERGKNGVIDRSITNVSVPTVTLYLPPAARATGTGIIVAPGGGYQHLAIDKEGHDIARWLNTMGIAALVLKYRLPGGGAIRASGEDLQGEAQAIHVALEDAEAAVALARHNAAKWHLKPDKIGFMGFSAGGLAARFSGARLPGSSRGARRDVVDAADVPGRCRGRHDRELR